MRLHCFRPIFGSQKNREASTVVSPHRHSPHYYCPSASGTSLHLLTLHRHVTVALTHSLHHSSLSELFVPWTWMKYDQGHLWIWYNKRFRRLSSSVTYLFMYRHQHLYPQHCDLGKQLAFYLLHRLAFFRMSHVCVCNLLHRTLRLLDYNHELHHE